VTLSNTDYTATPATSSAFPQVVPLSAGGFLLSFVRETGSAPGGLLTSVQVSDTGQLASGFTQGFGVSTQAVLASNGVNALALWGTKSSLNLTSGLMAGRVHMNGSPLDPAPFPVVQLQGANDTILSYSLTFDGTDYVAQWFADPGNGTPGVWLARIGTDGTLLDGPATQAGHVVLAKANPPSDPPALGRVGSGSLLAWREPGGPSGSLSGSQPGIAAARFTADGMLPDTTAQAQGLLVFGPPPVPAIGDAALTALGYGGATSLLVWRSATDYSSKGSYDLDYALVYPW
jgi:hypothetical protein